MVEGSYAYSATGSRPTTTSASSATASSADASCECSARCRLPWRVPAGEPTGTSSARCRGRPLAGLGVVLGHRPHRVTRRRCPATASRARAGAVGSFGQGMTLEQTLTGWAGHGACCDHEPHGLTYLYRQFMLSCPQPALHPPLVQGAEQGHEHHAHDFPQPGQGHAADGLHLDAVLVSPTATVSWARRARSTSAPANGVWHPARGAPQGWSANRSSGIDETASPPGAGPSRSAPRP